jgi:hypothetical protein
MRDTDRIWKKRYRWLLASTLVLVVFLVYWAVAGKGLPATLSDFWEAVLPNLAAALLIYLAVSLLLTWFGLSEADELRNEIAKRVAESVIPAPGIQSLTSRIDEIPWKELFEGSERIDVVGRFFDGVLIAADDGSLKTAAGSGW